MDAYNQGRFSYFVADSNIRLHLLFGYTYSAGVVEEGHTLEGAYSETGPLKMDFALV